MKEKNISEPSFFCAPIVLLFLLRLSLKTICACAHLNLFILPFVFIIPGILFYSQRSDDLETLASFRIGSGLPCFARNTF